MTNRKRIRGFAHERDLVLRFWRKGFAVIRAPASGSKTRRFAVPDAVAIKNRVIYAFEVKTVSEERIIYIPRHQVEKLVEFTERSGGRGFIAVKVIGSSGWRFIPVENLEETKGGNYRVTPEAMRHGYKLEDLVVLASGNKTLMDYACEDSEMDVVACDSGDK